jgi:hypothetical protein
MASRQKLTPESQEKLDTVLLDLAEFTNVFETDVKRAALVAAKILENVEREHAPPDAASPVPKKASVPATAAEKKSTPRSKATAEAKTASRSRTRKTTTSKKT